MAELVLSRLSCADLISVKAVCRDLYRAVARVVPAVMARVRSLDAWESMVRPLVEAQAEGAVHPLLVLRNFELCFAAQDALAPGAPWHPALLQHALHTHALRAAALASAGQQAQPAPLLAPECARDHEWQLESEATLERLAGTRDIARVRELVEADEERLRLCASLERVAPPVKWPRRALREITLILLESKSSDGIFVLSLAPARAVFGLIAPPHTPMAGSLVCVEMSFLAAGKEYPMNAPDIRVLTPVFHPRFAEDGTTDLFNACYSPAMGIAPLLRMIRDALWAPEEACRLSIRNEAANDLFLQGNAQVFQERVTRIARRHGLQIFTSSNDTGKRRKKKIELR